MARKHVIILPRSSNQRQRHRLVPPLGLFLVLYASNTFVMPSLVGHHIKSKTSLYAEGEDVTETTTVTIKKKLEEFKVGDEVDAVIAAKQRFGTLCHINAEKRVMLRASRKHCDWLNLGERVKAKIEEIDLEKRQAFIVILDLEELVQNRKKTKTTKKEQTFDPQAVEAVKGMEAGQALSGRVAYKNSFGVWADIGSAVKPKLVFGDKLLGYKLRVGEEVKLKVVDVDTAKGRCSAEVEDIETLVAGRPGQKEISTLKVGSVHNGHVALISKNRATGVRVDIGCVKEGKLKKPHPVYQRGQEVKVKVVKVDLEKGRFGLEIVSE